MYRLGLFAAVMIGLLAPAGCSSSASPNATGPTIRVKLLAAQDSVTVAASASPTFTSSGENTPRKLDFPGGAGVPVTLSPGGWRVGNVSFNPGELSINPAFIGSVKINGQAYRGRYRFVPVGADRFDVINDVDIDSYLMSVVSREMLRDWHEQAYMAQAITARTYALYEARVAGRNRSFDVHDDTKSQVYGGIDSETEKSRMAVQQTAGIVVAYGPQGQEKIFKAYFSSCCGGIGQSNVDAFGEADVPPLREKYVGSLCNASPRFNWGPITFKKEELTRRIRAWGARRDRPEKDMGTLVRIDVAAVNTYRRPVRFYLTDSKGLQYSLAGEELRWACNTEANGGPILLSSFVTPISERDSIQFVEGHGWGHGVGLCQWCAQARALKGQRHEDIVRHAYPGAVLVRAY